MIENKLKRLLQSGGTAIGTMICDARTPAIARALAVAGFDYFILDTEHGSYSLETVSDMMQMARLEGITPIVRVPDFSYPFIARTLDAGALGVMVPRVKTRAQVEQIVAAVKYPPMGERGMMNARTNTDYRGMTIREYGTWANAETMVIVQVETREAVEDIDALLAVPGVDAALMGPADLSVALGTMDVGHPTVTEYTQRVVDAARRCGLPSGTHVGDLDMLKTWRDRGMRLLMYNYDFGLMMSGGAAAIKELRP
jgi:2-keto-3-deoxy-L-rhamnonate aldolase RhmA